MTATQYDQDQNTVVDSTRGNLLTDVQMSAESTPMSSSTQQMALTDVTRHDIASILERPVNLGTYEWKTSDPSIPIQFKASDYLNNTVNYVQKLDFPQKIFSSSPLVVDKLKNYQYMKADIEIEVKINAQPFLQGALMLVYNPYYEQTSLFRQKGTRYLASQTSCPHKIVSIEEGNSLKLTCPYANIYDLFDLSNSQNQFGTAFLYVFSPLTGPTASETAKYTVFARFVNPRFYVPTHKDVIADARDAHERKRLEDRGYRFVAQSSIGPVSKDTGEVETSGPVSKVASGVSTVADALSGVPVIGQVASSVAWISRLVGKTAAVFGWSKPTSIEPQKKMIVKPNHTLIHTEGNDDATTLALLQDNGIDGSSFIPETKDEMDLKFIFGRPNYFHSKQADSTVFSGRKLITAWEVSPFSQYQYGETEDPQTMYLGSFAYASMLGTLWRGTINFDVMIIKTPYHQGRFAAVYLPETNVADAPATLGTLLNTNYSVVCNLKDRQDEMGRTTCRVSVPYISNVPWRETYKRGSSGPDATTLETKTGCVALYSLVDLSNPPTVASSVTFYVAHSGGEDYQISRPVMNLAPGFQKKYTSPARAYAQSDIGSVFIPEDENLLVPSSTNTDVSAYTTGEYFHSLRPFTKRYGKLTSLSQESEYASLRTRHMTEDDSGGFRIFSRKGFADKAMPTPWYMTSFLYRFYNGSSQMKLIPYTAGVLAEAYLSFSEETANVMTTNESEAIGQPLFQQNQQLSNAFEIRTPYYRGIRCDVVGSNQVPILGDVRTNIRCRNLASFGGNTQNSDLFEAAGDDFSFFFLVGPPPMSDIRNLTSVQPIPAGTTVEIDPSLASSCTVTTEGRASFNSVGVVPAPPAGYESAMLVEPDFTFNIKYTDGQSVPTSINECRLRIDPVIASIKFVETPILVPSTGIDTAATLADFVAKAKFSAIVTKF